MYIEGERMAPLGGGGLSYLRNLDQESTPDVARGVQGIPLLPAANSRAVIFRFRSPNRLPFRVGCFFGCGPSMLSARLIGCWSAMTEPRRQVAWSWAGRP